MSERIEGIEEKQGRTIVGREGEGMQTRLEAKQGLLEALIVVSERDEPEGVVPCQRRRGARR